MKCYIASKQSNENEGENPDKRPKFHSNCKFSSEINTQGKSNNVKNSAVVSKLSDTIKQYLIDRLMSFSKTETRVNNFFISKEMIWVQSHPPSITLFAHSRAAHVFFFFLLLLLLLRFLLFGWC